MTRIAALVCAAALAACGGSHTGQTMPRSDRAIDVEAAELPFRILSGQGGRELSSERFYRAAADARAICIGETHPNPHHHWAQLHILDRITQLATDSGRELALGMEMFQRPFQGVLDDYVAGRIDEGALLSRSGWEDRWGYDYALYRPMVRLAVERGGRLLALNAARELVKKVSREGLDELTPTERERLPEMNLDNPEHRAWWDELMASMGGAAAHGSGDESGGAVEPGGDDEEHGHGHGEADDEPSARSEWIYAAQVLWDEAMAQTAVDWLGGSDDRLVIILAGNGHCHDSAIAARMKRRGVEDVVSIRPIIDGEDSELSSLLASPMHDYLFVMSHPDD